MACESDADCSAGAACVGDARDYNGAPLPPRCLRPCQLTVDCNPYGSECDDRPAGGRYCF